jgi:ADP-heptose:LPS heptosyltransferase
MRACGCAWSRKAGGGVILLGDSGERKILESVQRGLQAPYAVACGEPLGVVGAILSRSRLLLGNDGGLPHLAHSLGVRTVSLFGPVDETVYGPYGDGVPHERVTVPVPCRPCYRRFHFPPCAHERRCLTEISVQKVLESMDKIA